MCVFDEDPAMTAHDLDFGQFKMRRIVERNRAWSKF